MTLMTQTTKEIYRNMSSKSRLWQFILEKKSITNAEIAEFMHGSKGQLSWGQRLREIRKEWQQRGGDLICKEERPGIYRYTLLMPE